MGGVLNGYYTGPGCEVHMQESAITADTNNLAVTASVLVLTPDNAWNLTGLDPSAFPLDDPATDCPIVWLVNGSAVNTLTLKHNSGSSTAGYRFLVSNGADKALGPYQTIQLTYAPVSGRTGWWVNA